MQSYPGLDIHKKVTAGASLRFDLHSLIIVSHGM